MSRGQVEGEGGQSLSCSVNGPTERPGRASCTEQQENGQLRLVLAKDSFRVKGRASSPLALKTFLIFGDGVDVLKILLVSYARNSSLV